MFGHFFKAVALGGLLAANAAAVETLTISGSSTVQPVVEAVAEAYHQQHPDVYFFIRGGGSSIGIRDAGKRHVDIGMASRPLKSFEIQRFKGLKTHLIGYDAVAFIVNRANKAKNLEFEHVQDIYLGNIRNWEELGGPDAPIDPISKKFGHATLDIFLYYFDLDAVNSEGADTFMHLKKQRHRGGFSSFRSRMFEGNNEIIDYVVSHPDALGYLSYGEAAEAVAKGVPIKILSLDGVDPDAKTIFSGKYPVRRDMNLVMYDDAPELAKTFLRFITEGEGRKIIKEKGFLLKLR